MAKFKYVVFLIAVFFTLNSYGQEITNVRVSQEGTSVVVLYDLAGKKAMYDINLFYTIDDGKTWTGPLKNITGDVAYQLEGKNKKAIWNTAAEKGQIEGTIQFKLLAGFSNKFDKGNENPYTETTTKPTFAPEYYKFKKSKTIWLTGALVSGAAGAFSYLQAETYYDQYQTATTDAPDLHQKVELFDKITPVTFAIAGFCALEFILKTGKQSKAKKQPLTFSPVSVKNGAGIGLAYTF